MPRTRALRRPAQILLLVVLLVVGVGILVNHQQSQSPTGDPTAAAGSGGVERDAGDLDEWQPGEPDPDQRDAVAPPSREHAHQDAETTLNKYVQQLSDLLSPRRGEPDMGTGVATATFRDELFASSEENRVLGLHVTGRPEVVSLKLAKINPEVDPMTAVAVVCLDNSSVTVRDAKGKVAQQQAIPKRTRQRFSLIRAGDQWLIDRQWFGQNPNC